MVPPRAAFGLLPLVLLPMPSAAQEVRDCPAVPPVTALVEPWEETSAVLGEGAIRLALLEEVEAAAGVGLLVLTLPPPPEPAEAEDAATEAPPAPPPERRCRLVDEGAIGFASVDLGALAAVADEGAATLSATLPALRFIPESTELEEVTLRLIFGVRDDSLRAEIEAAAP